MVSSSIVFVALDKSIITHWYVSSNVLFGNPLVIAGCTGKIASPKGPFEMETEPSVVVPVNDAAGLALAAVKVSVKPVMSTGTPFRRTFNKMVRESPRYIQSLPVSVL
jgi:hypothetical protein